MDVQALLHLCRLRLLDLSQGNRALKMPRLLAGRELDLHELGWQLGTTPGQLLAQLISGKKMQLLTPKAEANPETEQLARRLTRLHRHLRQQEQETGAYDLYVGYPFVQGRLPDGTTVRCPLLLFPVTLIRGAMTKGGWGLQPRKLDDAQLNEAFFRALEKSLSQPLSPEFWEADFALKQPDLQLLLNALYAHLRDHHIPLNFNSQLFLRQLDPMSNYTVAEMERWPVGELGLRAEAALGIFPPYHTALLQDYRLLEQQPDALGLHSLLHPPAPPSTALHPPRGNTYWPLPTDHSQHQALLLARSGAHMVVHGPPGTGKSQLIVNLAADYMSRGKNVLIVSEKRAALDVVHRRMTGIGLAPYTSLVHDYRADRDAVFAQLASLPAANPIEELAEEYAALARTQDSLARPWDERDRLLHSPLPCGHTPYALLLATQCQPPVGQPLPHRQVTRRSVEDFVLWADRLKPYEALLMPQHPWYQRIPLHTLSPVQRQVMGDCVDSLTADAQHLISLLPRLQTMGLQALQQPDFNQQAAEFLVWGEGLLASGNWDRIGAYLAQKQTPETLLATLQTLQETQKQWLTLIWVQGLDATQLQHKLDDLATLQQTGLLGWLKADWRQARRRIKVWLKTLGQKINKKTLAEAARQLQQGLHLWQRWQQLRAEPYWQALATEPTTQLAEWTETLTWLQQYYLAYTGLPSLRPATADATQWRKTLTKVHQAAEAWQQWQQQAAHWRSTLGEVLAGQVLAWVENKELAHVQALTDSYHPAELLALDTLLAELDTGQRALLVAVVAQGLWHQPDWADSLRHRLACAWLDDAEQEHPLLSDPLLPDFDLRIAQYSQLEDRLQGLLPSLIPQRLASQLTDATAQANPDRLRELQHQLTKKRRRWPLRRLLTTYWPELRPLLPCVLASPETVAAAFPLQAQAFDLVIVDEASQCPTERLLPVLLRGTQCVVVGDPHQLPPSDLFQVQVEVDQLVDEHYDPDRQLGSVVDSESILDLALQRFAPVHLLGHYRSRHPSLMAFSNRAFYQDRLQQLPALPGRELFDHPIVYHHIAGQAVKGVNAAEVRAVADVIELLLAHPAQPTLGVVTFNYAQQQALLDELDLRLTDHLRTGCSEQAERLGQAWDRRVDGIFEGLFVKNIENVQGDERDVVLFSIGYSANAQGRVPATFGWLNLEGGENRLNVAISRARHRVELFCSFLPEQLEVEHTLHRGPKLLKQYLRYAWAHSRGRSDEATTLLDQLSPATNTTNPTTKPAETLRPHLPNNLLIPTDTTLADAYLTDLRGQPETALLIESPHRGWRHLVQYAHTVLRPLGLPTQAVWLHRLFKKDIRQ